MLPTDFSKKSTFRIQNQSSDGMVKSCLGTRIHHCVLSRFPEIDCPTQISWPLSAPFIPLSFQIKSVIPGIKQWDHSNYHQLLLMSVMTYNLASSAEFHCPVQNSRCNDPIHFPHYFKVYFQNKKSTFRIQNQSSNGRVKSCLGTRLHLCVLANFLKLIDQLNVPFILLRLV